MSVVGRYGNSSGVGEVEVTGYVLALVSWDGVTLN